MRARRDAAVFLSTLLILTLIGTAAAADLADRRTTDFLNALKADDFAAAARNCTAAMKAHLPELESGWKRVIGAYGNLRAFKIVDRSSSAGVELRTANLDFQRPSGLAAQVAVDASGQVVGIHFVPAAVPAGAEKLADERANQMISRLRDGNFQAAEAHFDSRMKSLLPPHALEVAWKQRTSSLGTLAGWKLVSRTEIGGYLVRIVNLDFDKAPKAFALKISVDSAGHIGGFYFMEAQP